MSSKSNSVLVINLTNVQQHVDVVDSDGKKTSVNIMPKKRVSLEEGFVVCENWIGRNPKALKVHTPEEQAAAKAQNAKPATEPEVPTTSATKDKE